MAFSAVSTSSITSAQASAIISSDSLVSSFQSMSVTKEVYNEKNKITRLLQNPLPKEKFDDFGADSIFEKSGILQRVGDFSKIESASGSANFSRKGVLQEPLIYEFHRPRSPKPFLEKAKKASISYKDLSFHEISNKKSVALRNATFTKAHSTENLFLMNCPSFEQASSRQTLFVIDCPQYRSLKSTNIVIFNSPLLNICFEKSLTYYLPSKCKEICFQNCLLQGDLISDRPILRLLNSVVQGTVYFQGRKHHALKGTLILEGNSSVSNTKSVNGVIKKVTAQAAVPYHKKTVFIKNINGNKISLTKF